MPQTVYDQGDTITSRLKLGVTPDGTTTVLAAVSKPDGSSQSVAGPMGPSNDDEYTVQWLADYANGGDYVAVWTVTGTGASKSAKVYPVRPLPAASAARPLWAPFLSEVADHCPRLTVDTVTVGSQLEYGTFTGVTSPTDEQAQRLVDQAVNSIAVSLGTIPSSIQPLARVVASLRAAAAIVRAYHRSDADLAHARDLDARADAQWALLEETVTAVGGGTARLLPEWHFPPAGAPSSRTLTAPGTPGRIDELF